jgi:hypothetical protein
MKHILIVIALGAAAILSIGCADTSVPVERVSTSRTGSFDTGGIDPVTQSAIDDTNRQTQEDAQRMSDWITQQTNQQIIDQANQAAIQASIDTANAAAQAAADAAAAQQNFPVNP